MTRWKRRRLHRKLKREAEEDSSIKKKINPTDCSVDKTSVKKKADLTDCSVDKTLIKKKKDFTDCSVSKTSIKKKPDLTDCSVGKTSIKKKPDLTGCTLSKGDVSSHTCDGSNTTPFNKGGLNDRTHNSKSLNVTVPVDGLKVRFKKKYKDVDMAGVTEKEKVVGHDGIKGVVDGYKTSKDVSSNWLNLKQMLEKTKEENISRKRKLSSAKNKDVDAQNPKAKKHKLRKIQTFSKLKTESREKKTDKESPKPKPDIWFDDVDEILVEGMQEKTITKIKGNPLVKLGTFDGLTKAVAMDCEMVGVGEKGRESVLARVSIVNQYGNCVYDRYVKPQETVVDYRTFVSGVTRQHLINAEEFRDVQKDVCDILKGRILVGHALSNDLKVLFLDHPRKTVRDTSSYKPFRQLFNGRTPSLKKLTEKLLAVTVQEGQHDSVQDAQAAMKLYTIYRKRWEKDIKLGLTKLKKNKKTNLKE
ncbi:RNA exonuclease 4-like isoform X2 [Gigantopelta aegis]|nr:RNA exonuclease 4-like isoform X2 [Gigantopelta aegis]